MNKPEQPFADRTIREPECRQITGLCRSTRYMMEKEGAFPARRKLGGRAVGWLLSEVTAWQQCRTVKLSGSLKTPSCSTAAARRLPVIRYQARRIAGGIL
ncbi:TPA: AlpA family phage regulatory protein [Salmonella enterica]|uniref:AlpA family phage regulatory protein n=1 Tax=Salmonella enterica TaxID=28901 RepID=A0A743PAW8_SALER|nr:AlpA family phage regulatory protein [Salmonella enterica]